MQPIVESTASKAFLDTVKFDKDGLIPAVAQDWKSGKVLMLAYMNRESLAITLSEKKACYWSRSRQELWLKGETSGNVQHVKELLIDCDQDALVLKIEQTGGACHTGYESCFYRRVDDNGATHLIESIVFDAAETYGKLKSK
jgi:phosphoribosyl-AMP cyclohydrolase